MGKLKSVTQTSEWHAK